MPHRDTRELCESVYYRERFGICRRRLTPTNCPWDAFPGICRDCAPEPMHAAGWRHMSVDGRPPKWVPCVSPINYGSGGAYEHAVASIRRKANYPT